MGQAGCKLSPINGGEIIKELDALGLRLVKGPIVIGPGKEVCVG